MSRPKSLTDIRISGFVQRADGSWEKPKHDKTRDTRLGPYTQFQKQKDDCTRQAHYRPSQAALDGQGSGQFRVSVVIRISDQRDRDNDGAYSTLQDCLLAAIGRLTQMDSTTLRKYAASLKRR